MHRKAAPLIFLKFSFAFVMKHRKKYLLLNLVRALIIIIVFLISACQSPTEVEKKLNEAEALIMEFPDSSLVLLREISENELKNESEKAKYGLLLTMAEDKNWLDPKNDSIIDFAVAYYEKKRDKHYQILSNYYRGRVQYLRDELPKALISFYKSKEMAENEKDYFMAGLSCRGIAEIYVQTYNSSDELNYAIKQYQYIKASGMQPYLDYSILDLARAYNNNNNHDSSLYYSNITIDSAKLHKDKYLYYRALSYKGSNLFFLKKFEKALPLFNELIESGIAETEDSLNFIWNLFELNKYAEAEKWLAKISDKNKYFKTFLLYKLNKNKKYNNEALREIESLHGEANTQFRKAMNKSLSSSLADYFELESKLKEEEIRNSKLQKTLITISSLSVFIFLTFLIFYIRRIYYRNIYNKIILAEELEESLRKSKEGLNRYSGILQNLWLSKNVLLQELVEILERNTNSDLAKRQVADRVTKIITDISIKGKDIPMLEKQVNDVFDNLFTNFKNDLPNLKEEDYLLFLYSVIGFSLNNITLFLKENKIESIYNRKRRLKNKINHLKTGRKEIYLKFL